MDQIDTFKRSKTKLKYSIKVRDQICNLPYINLTVIGLRTLQALTKNSKLDNYFFFITIRNK